MLVAGYERIAREFRTLYKELEALPMSPAVEGMLAEGLENIASAERTAQTARESLERARLQQSRENGEPPATAA